MHSYKLKHPSFEKRQTDCKKVLQRYPDKIPVICEIKENSDLPHLEKSMFLIPTEMTAHQLNYIIRKRMKLEEHKSLYIFVNHRYLLKADSVMADIYSSRKDADGYLYLTLTQENTTG